MFCRVVAKYSSRISQEKVISMMDLMIGWKEITIFGSHTKMALFFCLAGVCDQNLFIKTSGSGVFLSFTHRVLVVKYRRQFFAEKGSGMVANRAYKFRMYPNDERENNISFPKCRKVKTIAINRGLRLPINEKTFCISSQDRITNAYD